MTTAQKGRDESVESPVVSVTMVMVLYNAHRTNELKSLVVWKK